VGLAAGYVTTLKDPRGDLLRFCGNSFLLVLDEVRGAAEDVSLGVKFSRVSAQTTAFLNRMDSKYRLVSKARSVLNSVISFSKLAMNRVKSDIGDEEASYGDQDKEEAMETFAATSYERYEAPSESVGSINGLPAGKKGYIFISLLHIYYFFAIQVRRSFIRSTLHSDDAPIGGGNLLDALDGIGLELFSQRTNALIMS
jgi:hypothetical protein